MSKHFTMIELVRSQAASRLCIDNTPAEAVSANLWRLAETLERIRLAIGSKAIHVTSGYRSPALNARIGGSKTSAHMDGRAADIVCRSLTPLQLARAIQSSGIVLDQLILEFGEWVHVGIARPGEVARGDVLTARLGPDGVKYQNGIVAA